MGYKFVMVIVILSLLLVVNGKHASAASTKHQVGGSQGWDESTDFSSWVSSQTFKVGDQLVFKYTPGLHSVVELASESAYKSCDTSTALDSKTGGNDVVKLDKPGSRYFACGTAGHCANGMKLKITTVAADSTTTTTNTPTSSSTSSSPTSAAASSTYHPFSAFLPLQYFILVSSFLGILILHLLFMSL